MAVRYAKIEYPDIVTFLKAWDKQISKGSVYLQAGTVEGELAGEPKLDLVVPGFGRVGPLSCQVVHRAPDGGVGLQIPEIPTAARNQVAEFLASLDNIKNYFVESGQLFTAEQVEARVAEVEVVAAAAAAAAADIAAAVPKARGADETLPLAEAAARGDEPEEDRELVLPDVQNIPPDHHGTMGDGSLDKVMITLAMQEATGLLTVTLPGGDKKFGFWSKGGPVGWRTDPTDQEEVLGVLLFRAEQVTKEQISESLAMMEAEGLRQGEAFIKMGVMTFDKLVDLLQRQCEYVFLRLLHRAEGSWTFHTLEAIPERFISPPVKSTDMIYRKTRKVVDQIDSKELYSSLRPELDKYVAVRDDMKEVLAATSWSPDEKKFLGFLEQRSWRLREVFTISNMGRRQTARFLTTVLRLDYLALEDAAGLERYQTYLKEFIVGKFNRLRTMHHFDSLEIHWICTADDVERGYQSTKKAFKPSAFHDLTDEHKQALEAINTRLEEAYGVLRDDARRRAYRGEHFERGMIVNSAELLSKQGEMARMRADVLAMQACFGKAAELVPEKRSYHDAYKAALILRPGA